MSGYEIGQRYRITVEGVLLEVGPASDNLYIGNSRLSPEHVVSVEKVEPPKPPLPTTPGSVIRFPTGIFAHLDSGNFWVDDNGVTCRATHVPHGWETVHDAGAES